MKSKRLTLWASVVLALLIVSGAWYFSTGKNNQKDSVSPDSGLKQVANLIAEKDSDNDGLKDWEEPLWGTDPQKSDTDGDKTNDGDEIKTNRDPLKPAPNDIRQETAKQTGVATSTEEITATDKFSRELFARYLAFKQGGEALDQKSQDIIISSMLAETQLDIKAPIHSSAEFKLSQDNSATALKNYGNLLGEAIISASPETSVNEIMILNEAVQAESGDKIKELDPIIEGYQKLIKLVMATAVPTEALSIHLNFVNSLEQVLANIKTFRQFFDDPVATLAGINSYEDSVAKLQSSITGFRSFFTAKRVVFEPNAPANALVGNF